MTYYLNEIEPNATPAKIAAYNKIVESLQEQGLKTANGLTSKFKKNKFELEVNKQTNEAKSTYPQLAIYYVMVRYAKRI